MIGDKLNISKEYFQLTNELICYLRENNLLHKRKLVIGIGGESGSGKSVTSICLQNALIEEGFPCLLIGMDDYFKLPAKDNHHNRQKDLVNVGPHEVRLDLLQKHIDSFLIGEESINAPLSDYDANLIKNQDINFSNIQIIIVEGTYVLSLPNLDVRIFLERDYKQTLEDRIKRGRESFDPFVEQVLNIEHEIISKYTKVADIVIDNAFKIKP